MHISIEEKEFLMTLIPFIEEHWPAFIDDRCSEEDEDVIEVIFDSLKQKIYN